MNRIPFWGWFLIILGVLFSTYNPSGYSIFHLWMSTELSQTLPVKVLLSVLVVGILGLVLNGVRQSMSLLGLLALLVLIGVPVWVVYYYTEFDLLNPNVWAWLAQPIVALILTVGWQWRKIWRNLTGIVGVNETAVE